MNELIKEIGQYTGSDGYNTDGDGTTGESYPGYDGDPADLGSTSDGQ